MATGTSHSHEIIATLKVKAVKQQMLFMSSLSDLQGLGRDSAARLKKDTKFKVMKNVSSSLSNRDSLFQEIADWNDANAEKVAEVAAANDVSPQDAILGIDIVGKIAGRAPCEIDTVYSDCAEHQSAEYGNILRGAIYSLEKVSRKYYAGAQNCWKSDFGAEATLSQVLAKASATLLQIPMDGLKSELQASEKASCNLKACRSSRLLR